MDYNYQYLAKCQSLYLVLFFIIYIGGDETILCTICILPPGLFINTNGAYVLWKKRKIILKISYNTFGTILTLDATTIALCNIQTDQINVSVMECNPTIKFLLCILIAQNRFLNL